MSQENANSDADSGEQSKPMPVQPDIEIGSETWDALAERVRQYTRRGDDPLTAWKRGVEEIVATTPNVIVDGEVRNLEDIDTVEDDVGEVDADGDGDNVESAPRADAHLAVGLLGDARQETFHAGDVLEAVDHIDSALDITTSTDARRRLERARAALDRVTDVDADKRDEQIANALSELAPIAAGVVDQKSSINPTYKDRFPQPPAGELPHLFEEALTAHPDEQPYFIRQAWRELARAYDSIEGPPEDIYSTTAPRPTSSGHSAEETALDRHEPTASEDKPTVPVFYNAPATAVDRAIGRFEHRVENPLRDDSPYQQDVVRLRDFIYSEIEETPVIWVDGVPLSRYVADAGAELKADRPRLEER